ncbi:hypothetical protein PybrP1_006094 [[Pythium] brassicae (nom. inval.)]|nr:hypothetical protein PybrP1_006094 [[Pythium] brassicae (nom. inval.)]
MAALTQRAPRDVALAAAATLESVEAQLAFVLLLALDVSCSTLALLLLRPPEPLAFSPQSTASVPLAAPIATAPRALMLLLEALTGFTLVASLLELVVLLAAFRSRFFAHAGYALDAGVVVIALVYELLTQSKALRLLGVLRVWRVFRLVNTLIERERQAHDVTRDELEKEQLKVLQLGAEKVAAQESLRREYESRSGLEKLLQGYKDEVETLKEALQIAADGAPNKLEEAAGGAGAEEQREAETTAASIDEFQDANALYMSSFLAAKAVPVVAASASVVFAISPWQTVAAIRQAKSTLQYSFAPFFFYFVSSVIYTLYAAVTANVVMGGTALLGALLGSYYVYVFYTHAGDKTQPARMLLLSLVFVTLLWLAVSHSPTEAQLIIGVPANILSVLTAASPLLQLKTILRLRDASCLPFGMSVMNVVAGGVWMVYGIMLQDALVIIPNLFALTMGTIQVSLILLFPGPGAAKGHGAAHVKRPEPEPALLVARACTKAEHERA